MKFEWQTVPYNPHNSITALQKQKQMTYNRQLINLERSIFAGKSQTSA